MSLFVVLVCRSNSIQIDPSLFNFRNVIYFSMVITPGYVVAPVQTLCYCSPTLFTQWIVKGSIYST